MVNRKVIVMKKKGFTLIEAMVVLVILVLVVCICFGLTGCGREKTSDDKMQEETAIAMQEAYAQTGMPAITNYQEKKLFKMIYELRDDEKLVCYAYYFNQMQGKRGDFIGKCIGFGLPASVQYSNPERIACKLVKGANVPNYSGTLPQPEPNGLFMPEGLSATWLMLIDPETNTPRPVYIEPLIIVSPFKLH